MNSMGRWKIVDVRFLNGFKCMVMVMFMKWEEWCIVCCVYSRWILCVIWCF